MKKRPREPKPLHPVLVSATGTSLIKHLASCNTTVRSQSLRLLQSWLASESNELSDSDIKKLWKGLFYCLWHADKSPNQVALIEKLTSLFLMLQPPLALEFFRGFLVTLRREWPGIDRLRLDKFYLLTRRFVKALFELLRLRKWDVKVVGEYFRVLENDGFLVADDKLQGNGVSYHVASVFLEELKGVGFPVEKGVVDVMLGPFLAVLGRSKDRVLLGKVRSCVFDELLKLGSEVLERKRVGEVCEGKGGDDVLGLVALKMELSGKFYEVGSAVECVQGNRKVALGLHEGFLKLEKELKLSGIEIVVPDYCDDVDGDVAPQLIPIDFSTSNGNMEIALQEGAEDTLEDGGQADGISRKKSKKAKKVIDGDDKKARKGVDRDGKKAKKGIDGDDKKAKKGIDGDEKKAKKGINGDEKKSKKGINGDVKKAKKGIDGDDKKARKGIDGDDKEVNQGIDGDDNQAKKGIDGDDKKAKKKKKKKQGKDNNENTVAADDVENGLSSDLNTDLENGGSDMDLNETVISNLQKQFERVAAESGSYLDDDRDFLDTPVKQGMPAKKRKRSKGVAKESGNQKSNGTVDGEVDAGAKSVDKSAKKVRFSMKNNLVWKPQTPLPPESLRIPPSVTPRGSALKKGVPPGPVIEIPTMKKKLKQKKKAQRKKMQTRSV